MVSGIIMLIKRKSLNWDFIIIIILIGKVSEISCNRNFQMEKLNISKIEKFNKINAFVIILPILIIIVKYLP